MHNLYLKKSGRVLWNATTRKACLSVPSLKKLAFHVHTSPPLFNKTHNNQTFNKEQIEKIRDLISENFPKKEYKYPILFDSKLLEVNDFDIQFLDEEHQNTLGSAKRSFDQADLEEAKENPNKPRRKKQPICNMHPFTCSKRFF